MYEILSGYFNLLAFHPQNAKAHAIPRPRIQ